ncbi:hypothetical protein GCM10008107_14590 [Psychrosphaera saromensis]|uniref:hypothetical protein n=1 Tax=Psychrosphaera saromensis TaxID=716813 RepID=UPI0015E412CA|nr:hypothetical protein [Psychrosphaera saromensis]GHB66467.1 hypothetical protein GCM10008107_14590 [Psychrosphaera saromensis]GLQ14915.1 hypothetical protein GCM10007917_23700 [Psychrosphaera saromensis]
MGEAIKEYRNEIPTDAFGEVLANIVLRVLDIAHLQGIDLEKESLTKMVINEQRATRG